MSGTRGMAVAIVSIICLQSVAYAGVAGAPPEVTSTVPADTAVDVLLDSTIEVTFDERMDSTVFDAHFTVTDLSGPVAGVVSFNANNKVMTFDPTLDMAPGALHTVTILGTAVGEGGTFTFDGNGDGTGDGTTNDNYVFTFTTVSPTATKVVISSAGGTFAATQHTTLSVEIQDAGDILMTSDNTTVVTFTPTSGGAVSAVLTGTSASPLGLPATAVDVTVAGGQAQIQLTDDTAETFTVEITNDQTLTDPADDSITVTDPPTQVVVTDPGADFAAGQGTTVTVEIQDGSNALVATDNETIVTFTPTGAGFITAVSTGTTTDTLDVPAGAVAVTVAGGIATVDVNDNSVESFDLGFTSDATLTDPTALTFDVTSVVATQIVIPAGGAGQDFQAGDSTTVDAQIRGAGGVLVVTDNTTVLTFNVDGSATFTAVSTGSTATSLPAATVDVTVSGGIAVVVLTDTVTETINVAVTDNGPLTEPADDVIDVLPGDPAEVSIATAPADYTAGASTNIGIEILDAYGNLVSTDSATVLTFAPTGVGTITAVPDGTGDTSYDVEGGSEDVTVAAGLATVTIGGSKAGTFTVAISNDQSATDPAAPSITVSPDVASNITVPVAPLDFIVDGTTTLSALVTDQYGNLIASDTTTVVTFAPTSGGTVTAVGPGTTTDTLDLAATAVDVTVAAGAAAVTLTDATVEQFDVDITNDGGYGDPGTFTITVSDTPTQVVVTTPGGAIVAGGTATLTVEVQDSSGTLVVGDYATAITFAPALSGTITGVITGTGDDSYDVVGGAETVTVVGGVASITLTDLVAEAFDVAISNDGGLADPSADTITVTPDVAAAVVVVSPAGEFAPGETTTLTVEIHDQYGNTLTTDNMTVVTFTPSSGGTIEDILTVGGDGAYGTAGGAEAVTAENGVITIVVTNATAETFTLTITSPGITNAPVQTITVTVANDSPFGGGCTPGASSSALLVGLLVLASAALLRRRAVTAVALVALMLVAGCDTSATLNNGIMGTGARLGYITPAGESGSDYGPSPVIGISYAGLIPGLEAGLDYVAIESEDTDATASIIRLRAGYMFGKWDVTGAASFYGLGGYSLLMASVSDSNVDSETSSGVDVGIGVASALSHWDARLTYSVLVGSENISGLLALEGGYYF